MDYRLSEPARRELNVLLRQLQPNESVITLDSHLQKHHREIADFLVHGDFVTKTGVYQFDLNLPNGAELLDAHTVEEYDNRQNRKRGGQVLVTDDNYKKPEGSALAVPERWPEAEDVLVVPPEPVHKEALWQTAPTAATPGLPERPQAIAPPVPAREQTPYPPKEEIKERPKEEVPQRQHLDLKLPAKEEAKKPHEVEIKAVPKTGMQHPVESAPKVTAAPRESVPEPELPPPGMPKWMELPKDEPRTIAKDAAKKIAKEEVPWTAPDTEPEIKITEEPVPANRTSAQPMVLYAVSAASVIIAIISMMYAVHASNALRQAQEQAEQAMNTKLQQSNTELHAYIDSIYRKEHDLPGKNRK